MMTWLGQIGLAEGSGGHVVVDIAVRTHQIAVVDTDDELIAVCLDHLRGGLRDGDLVVAMLAAAPAAHVRQQLPSVRVIDHPGSALREPDVVAAQVELLARAAAEGRRLRVLGQVQARGPLSWDERLRGDIAHQHVFADSTMASLCIYDRRTTPSEVLTAALRAHAEIVVDGAVVANPGHRLPAELMATLAVPDEPLQRTVPVLAVDGAPSLPELRHKLRVALAGRLGSAECAEDVHLAASEIAANAFRHGGHPVSARVWADEERVVVTVSDGGTGFDGCLSGFRPAHGEDLSRGGMGLWLARKLCDHVHTWQDAGGSTVRLTTAVRHGT